MQKSYSAYQKGEGESKINNLAAAKSSSKGISAKKSMQNPHLQARKTVDDDFSKLMHMQSTYVSTDAKNRNSDLNLTNQNQSTNASEMQKMQRGQQVGFQHVEQAGQHRADSEVRRKGAGRPEEQAYAGGLAGSNAKASGGKANRKAAYAQNRDLDLDLQVEEDYLERDMPEAPGD